GRVLVPIELEGARQDLDRSGGRALTPVQQAWDYANHSPGCRFIIVSNYKETRLYSTAPPTSARPSSSTTSPRSTASSASITSSPASASSDPPPTSLPPSRRSWM